MVQTLHQMHMPVVQQQQPTPEAVEERRKAESEEAQTVEGRHEEKPVGKASESVPQDPKQGESVASKLFSKRLSAGTEKEGKKGGHKDGKFEFFGLESFDNERKSSGEN